MLSEKLKDYNIILASGSPRRQNFFKELAIDFTIDVREVEEVYPSNLSAFEITDYLSILKSKAFSDISEKDIVITSDTIVWHNDKPVEKPKNTSEAKNMLASLSNSMHEVYTSVCFTSVDSQTVVNDVTKVWFKELSEEEIDYYISTYKPFDKAGSYGIQEWLGYIAIDRIEGSFFNVMGLPTHLVYKTLMEISG